MASYDSRAVDMRAANYEVAPARRSNNLTVVETGRRSSDALPGYVVTAIKCAVAFVSVATAVFFAKVLLVSIAFGYAADNATLNNSLEDARSVACDLEIQLADLSSKDRVWANATQAHGMTYTDDVVYVDVLNPVPAVLSTDDGESE